MRERDFDFPPSAPSELFSRVQHGAEGQQGGRILSCRAYCVIMAALMTARDYGSRAHARSALSGLMSKLKHSLGISACICSGRQLKGAGTGRYDGVGVKGRIFGRATFSLGVLSRFMGNDCFWFKIMFCFEFCQWVRILFFLSFEHESCPLCYGLFQRFYCPNTYFRLNVRTTNDTRTLLSNM